MKQTFGADEKSIHAEQQPVQHQRGAALSTGAHHPPLLDRGETATGSASSHRGASMLLVGRNQSPTIGCH